MHSTAQPTGPVCCKQGPGLADNSLLVPWSFISSLACPRAPGLSLAIESTQLAACPRPMQHNFAGGATPKPCMRPAHLFSQQPAGCLFLLGLLLLLRVRALPGSCQVRSPDLLFVPVQSKRPVGTSQPRP